MTILGLSELRWKGAGKIPSEEFTIMYLGGDYPHRGVGIVMDLECSKALKGIWCVNDRVIVVRISGKPFDIGMNQCYAPTADKNMDEIEALYEDVEKAMKQLKTTDVKITIGDFNAKVGRERVDTDIGEMNKKGEKNW